MAKTTTTKNTPRRVLAARILRRAEVLCRQKNLRFTRLRRHVLELVWQSAAPVKAYALLEKIDAAIGATKPVTVYRALDFLLQNGLVHKLNTQNAYVGCAHPAEHRQAWCIITHCRRCGRADDCCDDKIAGAITRLTRQRGFQATDVALEIEGVCTRCVKRRAAR